MNRTLFLATLLGALVACDPEPSQTNNVNNVNNNANNVNNTNNQHDGGVDADADADVDPDPEWLVSPAALCVPVGSPCAVADPMPGVFADFRKDFFLPYADYRESGEDPVNGGRFQIVANAAVGGTVTAVRLNGVEVSTLLREPDLEWHHVWPTAVTAGAPVWFHFHSRNPAWNSATSGRLTIETTAGNAVDADFPVRPAPVRMTYVTVTEDLGTLLVHLKNEDAAAHTISRVWVNGADALARGACLPKARLEPQEILVQAMSVVAAGAKGLMWFQSPISEADHAPARWEAIARSNWWIRRLRAFLREGDINQLAVSTDNVIVDQVRSRRALIVPIISLVTQNTVSDTDCAMTFTLESMVPHWTLAPTSVSVTVEVPEDFGVLEWFEVGWGGTSDLAYNVSVSGRRITVSGIPLDNTTPARVLVFAADAQVREEMDAP